MFDKRGVNKNFAIFAGKHLRQTCNFIKKDRCFHVNIAKFLTTYFYRSLPLAAFFWRLPLAHFMSQSFKFSDVFREYKEGPVTKNGLSSA